MKKVLVIGATGSCGAYTTVDLKAKGYEVVAVAHRPSDNGFFEEKGIPYYSIDLKDKSSFEQLPKAIDVVLHFAGAMPARMKATILMNMLIVLSLVHSTYWNGCER